MADRIEVHDGTIYVEQAQGPDGPTHFVRLGDDRITPRAAGDLIANPNVSHVDWDTGWIYPTLINGWENYGSSFTPARYRMTPNRVVFIDGLVRYGTINTSVFILPTTHRPARRLINCSMDTGNAAPERLDILNDGGVRPVTGSNGWQTLICTFYSDYGGQG